MAFGDSFLPLENGDIIFANQEGGLAKAHFVSREEAIQREIEKTAKSVKETEITENDNINKANAVHKIDEWVEIGGIRLPIHTRKKGQ